MIAPPPTDIAKYDLTQRIEGVGVESSDPKNSIA